MPRFNGAGPIGKGQRSEGGGICPPGAATNDTLSGKISPIGIPQNGGCKRFGRTGRKEVQGFRSGFCGPQAMTKQDEETMLNNRAASLEEELAAIRYQLATFEKDIDGKAR